MIEAATTQERYATAIQSSHLRVEGEYVRGPMDYVIAAGWCKSKFGAALMRLQAEWDGAERRVPVKPTKRDILRDAQLESIKMSDGTRVRRITTASTKAARERLEKTYNAELAKVKVALKSLPEVISHLEIKLLLDGQSAELAAPLVLYWLDPVCKVCNGTGLQAKSEKGCGKCREHPGRAHVPGGEYGKDVLQFLDDLQRTASASVRSSIG